ncbi:helix-turn-helix domain-containing protein [Carnobacterium gallinarum]|uniref:helix-turn-helix domain-containing protein n=1 Tax=Carnobacterium gallinarum TaxID=2749 RepID=UPI0005565A0A|nr:helix-turn-helix transcriptional regulator [Carnobacterium gallinarum]
MGHLGGKIKEIRLIKGITQRELAEGICTQATISNLENETSLPSLSILLSIADRLNIDFSEIYEYIAINGNSYSEIFKRVRVMCGQRKHKEAYDLIKEKIEFDKLGTPYELKQYYYYIGITNLIGFKNYSDAHYYFNLALSTVVGKNLDFLDVLATNGIGVAYLMDNELEKARTYFEKSLVQLNEIIGTSNSLQDSLEITKIYYNTAKFYSSVEDYEKAIQLSTLGIDLLHRENLSYYLDFLLYEKGFNLMKLGEKTEASEYYFYAAAMAKLNNNEHAIEGIKADMKKYKIPSYKYS